MNDNYGINAGEAWKITKGKISVKVGIIDTGINSNAAEFGSRLVTGREFINNTTNTTDAFGHGTPVAGIVGSVNYGVAPNVTLVPLKVSQSAYPYYEECSQVIKAVEYAKSNGISILNFSGGWSAKPSPDDAPWRNYDSALYNTIKNYPGLFVCSAGNNERDNDGSYPVYPASYDLPNLISVGAINSGGNIAAGSNYGAKSVDIFAPTGVATINHSSFPGTSAAAPFVAGTAALMLSVNPDLNGAELKKYIMQTGDSDTALANYCVSGKRLNAYKAVALVNNTPVMQNKISISTAAQLSAIRNNPDGHYVLTNNIDLSAYNGGNWDSIPSLGVNGILHGNGFTISNMKIQLPNVVASFTRFGLFRTNNGLIYNVNMSGMMVKNAGGDHGSPQVDVGSIAGCNSATGIIQNVNITGNGKTTSQTLEIHRMNSRVGGAVGHNVGMMMHVWVRNAIIHGNGHLGGVVGLNNNEAGGYGYIRYVGADKITVKHYLVDEDRNIGGIVGRCVNASMMDVTINDIYIENIGKNTGIAIPHMGFIVGYFSGSTIKNIYAYGPNSYNLGSLASGLIVQIARSFRITDPVGWGWAGYTYNENNISR